MKDTLYKYLLMLGDNSMILGHRLSELCGHGPSLETDIALTNISLDLFGQVRNYFQYAAELDGNGTTEDTIAFLRKEREYYNVVLVEQPNENFAHVIVRQYLFDAYHQLLLSELMISKDQRIVAIATKSIKESKYHKRFSSEWVKRLGAGTEVSHDKMQEAVTHLYPFAEEFFKVSAVEAEMEKQDIGPDSSLLKDKFYEEVQTVFDEANLTVADLKPRVVKGKEGMHSEHMGFVLNELQYMQRAYPDMKW